MPFITTTDGTEIYYTEQGTGQPVILSHGWPLSSDAWQVELKLFADAGYRAIAHDRRGHGRSAKTYQGNDMDTYARDLAELVEALDLHDVVVVGHSTGGGEVVRYAAQHGVGRVAKVVTVGAVPPLMLKTESNPEGTPIEAFDGIRAGVLSDALAVLPGPDRAVLRRQPRGVVGRRRARRTTSGARACWSNLAAAYDCVKAFSETDFTEDLKALDVPIFIAHGDDDQIVPIGAAALKTAEIVKHGTLKVYPGAPHGIYGDYQVALDADILDFIAK